ncbi:MAG: type VI secretion system accessory protein TagJ [Candidatus Competibacter sp.]|jgi:type VI secretion system protein ImpE|nr:type VI secretion system accessory protein TagJ [Candidatus Competibacter sp.]
MQAEQSVREGRLREALAELQAQVRKEPANAKYRIFLFQLLAVLGQWERASNQLNVLEEMDPESLPMVQTYREALRCELLRAEVFAGRRSPLIFGDPEPWMALLLEALQLTADGHHAQAQTTRDQAFEGAAATAGTLDGQPFEWLADADPRLGPMLEAIINGRYYWVPWQRIRTLALERPSDLRDYVWMPAGFTWANGGEAVGLIPSRYPGSQASADPQVQLGRKTEWLEQESGIYLGIGQRMLATDQNEYPLLDIRRIDLAVPEAASPATTDSDDG